MAVISFDFGSANSGALINPVGKEYNPNELIYVHVQDGEQSYPKQPTVFWVHRDLLGKEFIDSQDINISSCVYYSKEFDKNANFIWTSQKIMERVSELGKPDSEWVRFNNPKMEIYKIGTEDEKAGLIKGSDGKFYPLEKILKLFFTVIKKECLHIIEREGIISSTPNEWVVSVPGMAIWNYKGMAMMKRVIEEVMGDHVTFLTEPECALVGLNLKGGNVESIRNNTVNLIVDIGGGTTDIVAIEEIEKEGNRFFRELSYKNNSEKDPVVSIPYGGNDIDLNFITLFCNTLGKGVFKPSERVKLFEDFSRDVPTGASRFMSNWRDLQFSEEVNDDKVYFSPGGKYRQWIKTFYPQLADKVAGEVQWDGAEFRHKVFGIVYDAIIKAVEEITDGLSDKKINLDCLYFAGGLSRDPNLRIRIIETVKSRFPGVKISNISFGSVVGAVQRGCNHLFLNKEWLIARTPRQNYYVVFSARTEDFDIQEYEKEAYGQYTKLGVRIPFREFSKTIRKQTDNLQPDEEGIVKYLWPLCLQYIPVDYDMKYTAHALYPETQTGVSFKIVSSPTPFLLTEESSCKPATILKYDFGYNFERCSLQLDVTSSVVNDEIKFVLWDKNDKVV